MSKRILTALGIGLIAAGANAQSHLTTSILQTGSDVVVTTTGTIDTSGFVLVNPFASYFGSIDGSSLPRWYVLSGSGNYSYYYASMTLLSGTGVLFSAPSATAYSTSDTGDFFGFGEQSGYYDVGVSNSYSPGSGYNSSSTFAGQTFSSLNLVAGTHVFGYGAGNANTVTFQIGPSSAVPEPGEWAAIGILGAGLTGLVICKRRKG